MASNPAAIRTAALGLALAALPALRAHDTVTTKLTWAREVSRIFQKRCMGCHQGGGSAPFALTSWAEARPWAVAIREEVNARRMPPWNAVKGFGVFRNDMALSQEEIAVITDWCNGGAPEGDKRLESDILPRLWQPGELPGARVLVVSGSAMLATPAKIEGIRVESLKEGASARVILERPDGSVEPLVWVSDYRPAWKQTYVLREPIAAPAGSRVSVAGPAPAKVHLLVAAPGGK